ncbi:isocitrate/isopropylmalate dehydrogenase family protein [Amycolatopsis sp. K13G38]|uniref:Isocitrate/isopropylmalate dehydrogenase family protein n=1 Tax=Amycolatopsis acididurans TaxID=2724524 RepID=A0ABX1J2G8_9PSEU|nr:isocitrate/isopropylmalate family dehydrogenase [Amycolatopsis acididurans]NKQ53953.1 isocitrate/isopropylmalate dehydrogenase family protein [Amycolatopsis acididurans]
MGTHRIALIRGDGIGPELVDAALTVLGTVTGELDYVDVDAGAGTYRRTGVACAPQDVELMRTGVDATLKGPVGLPDVRFPDGTEAGVLGGILRTGLDLYANVRPVLLLPGVSSALAAPGPIDYTIVRENTEGLYASRGKGVGNRWAVSDTLLTTREGTARVCRHAFERARRKVTCVDKSNVLRSHALFREVFTEVAADYPDIATEFVYADAAAQALVLRPADFDVLVMENFLGDVLSDLGGATVGGISLCPAGNIGDHGAYFEPIHGSAPGLADRGLANPVGQILAAAMMLDHLGRGADGDRVRAAVAGALAAGAVRIRPDGSAEGGPGAVADAIVSFVD